MNARKRRSNSLMPKEHEGAESMVCSSFKGPPTTMMIHQRQNYSTVPSKLTLFDGSYGSSLPSKMTSTFYLFPSFFEKDLMLYAFYLSCELVITPSSSSIIKHLFIMHILEVSFSNKKNIVRNK